VARALDLRLELQSVTPRVWRVLRVPADLRLDDLHHAIQAVMGWDDFHPHVFEVGDSEYGPRPELVDVDGGEPFEEKSAWAGEGSDITVAQALELGPDAFTYIYDFDDDWRVRITRDGEAEAEGPVTVECLAGEHGGPQQESRAPEPFTIGTVNRRLVRALRPRATPEFPAGARASADQQLLANLSLAVLLLGSRPTRHGTREAWKQVRVEILDALHEAGLIDSDPQRKSVTITDAGVAHAQRLLRKLRTL
jgi:ribosomal protein S19E (S16A)